jgi:AraC-like DNA-binding protein
MPIIVDKDAVRMEILMAFQRCIDKKPMTSISLRDIAAEAGMSHPKLLNYFENKDDLILTYCRYTRQYMSEKCSQWFMEHDRKNYDSNLAYMNAFMEYVAGGRVGEPGPTPPPRLMFWPITTATWGSWCGANTRPGGSSWSSACRIYGPEVGMKEAEAMMILIAGTFICNYNGALTGDINDNIIGYLSNLAKS